MLSEADLGIFFRAPKHIREEYSDIKGVDSHQELKNIFSSASSFIKN